MIRKSTFVKSTIILLIGGGITKLLGMVIKIVMTRAIGTEGIGLYMLISPTFMLLIAIAQLGFPIAISTLVATEKKNNTNLVFSIIPIALLINTFLLVFVFLISQTLATHLLHEERVYLGILSMAFVLPFVILIISLFVFIGILQHELSAALCSLCLLIPYYYILWLCRKRLEKTFTFSVEPFLST